MNAGLTGPARDNMSTLDHVRALSSGTISTLLHENGVEETDYDELDVWHYRFIRFCQGANYPTWQSAWRDFVSTGIIRERA